MTTTTTTARPVPAEVPHEARRDRAPNPAPNRATDRATDRPARRAWPVAVLALPAFVAIWSGWVGLGGLTGFGTVRPLPGTPLSGWTLDTAITLPIGVETYAAYAIGAWLSGRLPARAARFAKWSAIGSLILGAAGQVTYHLMTAAGCTAAPWPITTAVACLPVAVLGMGVALAHLVHDHSPAADTTTTVADLIDAASDDQPADQGTEPETEQGTGPGIERGTGVTASRPRTPATPATSTGVRVRRLRAAHPDWTVAQIADRAGVSARTARRHLNAPTDPAGRAGRAGRPGPDAEPAAA